MKSKNNMEKVENLLKCNDKLIEINDLFKKNKEKLNYYKKVVKDSNDAIVIQNFNGIVKSWNKGAERIYGFKAQEMIGKNILKIIDKKHRKSALKNIQDIKSGKPTFRVSQIRRTKDKKEVSVWIIYSPIYEDEEIIEIGTTEQDVTKNLKSIVDLRKSEYILKVVTEAIPEGMNIVDEKCNILWMNDNFLKIYGKSAIGKKCYEVYKSYRKQCKWCPWKKSFKVGKIKSLIVERFSGDKVFELEQIGIMFKGKKAILEIFRDITEKEKMKKKIIEEKDLAQRFFHLAGTVILGLDINGRINLINKKGEEVLEANEKEILGKNWFNNFIKEGQREEIRGVFNKLMKRENSLVVDYENPIITAKNKEKLILWHNTLLKDYNGKIIGILSSGEDVTKKRKIEMELKKSKEELEKKVVERTADLQKAYEDLKELEVVKSDFLNMISHELKTPLTAMSAHLEILRDKSFVDINKDKALYNLSLEAIKRNNDQLKILIGNLLELSRIQSGKFFLNISKVDAVEVVSGVIENLDILAKLKGIKIVKDFRKLPMINTDKERLVEIFNNLIGNAIKFTENGHVKVKCQREGEFVVFEIIDTGIGIKEEHLSHLFEKFYQAGMGYSRKHEGVGLGLSITKQLLDLQGGMISVKSVYGKGSNFTIKIPIRYKKSKEYIALGKKEDGVKKFVEKKENEHLNPLEKEDMAIKNLFDNINEKNVFKKLKGGAKNVKKKYTLHRG